MPPPGGFEHVKYKRNLPFRGPSSYVVLGGVTAICAYGFYRLGKGNLEKRELQRENVWSRIHLVPLLMAEGDRDMYRREQAALAREKEIMKDVTGWEFPRLYYAPIDSPMKPASPVLTFDDSSACSPTDTDQMLFGPFDFEEFVTSTSPDPSWNPFTDLDDDVKPKPGYDYTGSPLHPNFGLDASHASPTDSGYFDSTGSYGMAMQKSSPLPDNHLILSNWINDPELSLASSSSPIPIPSPGNVSQTSSSFIPFPEHLHFPQNAAFSPTEFAALHPLPRSMSPTSSIEEQYSPRQRVESISPQDTSLHTPSWASQLYVPRALRSSSSSRPSVRHSPLDSTVRPRVSSLRGSVTSGQLFQPSSAPAFTEPSATRAYSRRADSVSAGEDPDATVRRKKRSPPVEDPVTQAKANPEPVLKSVLRPPKLAPSAWQLYFTDWIQKQQAFGTRKLNVAQAAKEAGQEYASLTNEEKEPYKRRSQAAKEARERELAAYMRKLTPDDIKRENAFRAAQRKAGKSRKSNIKDPNAPKKPLSAYFMFLQRIRANPHLVQEIFGDETETTKQSVLAAAKWRSMTDAERQPFLAQAEQEKMEYEAARRIYEEGSPSYGSSNINFSILPGSPPFPTMKLESESESDGNAADDRLDRALRS
ncbi:putative high mobility group protein [Lyophyllum shimeji]|uniref:High mobility group protein n=1 Tax=Lyophyllum shimeji TaxID=47721 RepID=A0A9P3UI82_LYOSH|nr:putative high mobility group protein [Lyophyllum shimeji]